LFLGEINGIWQFGAGRRGATAEFDPGSEQSRLVEWDPNHPFSGVHDPKLTDFTVHGNQIWATYGDTHVIRMEQGRRIEEGQMFPNTLLNGGRAVDFLSTPYGLIVIGEATLGLMETSDPLERNEAEPVRTRQ